MRSVSGYRTWSAAVRSPNRPVGPAVWTAQPPTRAVRLISVSFTGTVSLDDIGATPEATVPAPEGIGPANEFRRRPDDARGPPVHQKNERSATRGSG